MQYPRRTPTRDSRLERACYEAARRHERKLDCIMLVIGFIVMLAIGGFFYLVV